MQIEITSSGDDQGRVFDFQQTAEISIGRSRACTICLNDAEASRTHARILFNGSKAVIEELNSKNGVFVNGRTVFKATLAERDEILIGGTVLTVRDLPSPGIETASFRPGDTRSRVMVALPQHDADLLGGKSFSASVAELEHENGILREICRISQLIASKGDRQAILQTILDEMRDLLHADTACLLRRAEEEGEWCADAYSGAGADGGLLRVSHTIIRQALEEEKSILSTDPMLDERFDPSQSIVAQGVSSAMCSPVRVGSGFGGVLFLDRRKRGESFSTMDLRLCASAANILSIFLEKEEHEAEARRSARLAAVGEVMASLAHYIKNVITGLRLTMATMRAAVSQQRMDKIGHYLDLLSEQERRISNLMLNMLTYVKDRKPGRTIVKVDDLVRGAIDPLRPKLEENGIRFVLNCDERTPALFADEMSLHRILLNFILNTLDAFEGKQGGAEKLIRVTVKPLDTGPGAAVSFYDTGSGIAPDKLKKVFAAFYSTKGSRGTGLGLAVVQKLVQEHGGQISVDSKEHEWTEFRFTIPWDEREMAAALESAARAP